MYGNTIPTQPHSGLGIAAFVISLAAGAVLVILMGVAGVIEAQTGGIDEESPGAILIGLVMALTGLAQLLALGLGIGALVQAGRNKLFGVLGTVFAATGFLGTLLLVLLGTLLES